MIQHHIRELDHFVSSHAHLTAVTVGTSYTEYQITYPVVPNLETMDTQFTVKWLTDLCGAS